MSPSNHKANEKCMKTRRVVVHMIEKKTKLTQPPNNKIVVHNIKHENKYICTKIERSTLYTILTQMIINEF